MRERTVNCLSAEGFHRMHYVEWGDPAASRVVVCVHGLTRNGRDFDDWTGGTTRDPREIVALSAEDRTAWDAKMKQGIDTHWRVADGVLVSDGHEPYLATKEDFGDFELWVDWK